MTSYGDLIKFGHIFLIAPLLIYVGTNGCDQRVNKNVCNALIVLGVLAILHHTGIFRITDYLIEKYDDSKRQILYVNKEDEGKRRHYITIRDYAYHPKNLIIKKGDTVTWTNTDEVGHTVTSTSGLALDSPMLGLGESFTKEFTESTTQDYYCIPHPWMKGSVKVVDEIDERKLFEKRLLCNKIDMRC